MIRLFAVIACLIVGLSPAAAKEYLPTDLIQVGVSENIGGQLTLGTEFTDHLGKTVTLKDAIGEKPTILALVYYNCPRLCHFSLNALQSGISGLKLKLGKDYRVVTISFDPRDTVKSAADFYGRYTETVEDKSAWAFLIGKSDAIRTVSTEVGFKYRYLEDQNEFAHSAAIFILTPEGKISRYFHGLTYEPFDLKLSILEAKKKKTLNSIERGLLFCYNYDPNTNGYSIKAKSAMKLAGTLTMILVAGMLLYFYKKEKQQR